MSVKKARVGKRKLRSPKPARFADEFFGRKFWRWVLGFGFSELVSSLILRLVADPSQSLGQTELMGVIAAHPIP
jgi:hypothetical protein